MPRSFSRPHLDLKRLTQPRVAVRVVLGVLVLANLVAALLVFKPWAASIDDLQRRAAALNRQIGQKQAELVRLRALVNKVQSARSDGDQFMDQYLLARRTAASTLLDELEQTARKAGIKFKEGSSSYEPVEGYEALTKASITATYEGTYADLIHYLNLLDRSPRFLIIDTLAAAPQQTGLLLNITLRLDAFVREGAPANAPSPAVANEGQAPVRPQLAAAQGGVR